MRSLNPSDPSVGATYNSRFISNYLTLPVTVQYTRGRRIKYTGEAGVFTGVLIRETYKWKQINGSNFETTDVTNTSKRMDAGLSLGFRTSFPLTEKLKYQCFIAR